MLQADSNQSTNTVHSGQSSSAISTIMTSAAVNHPPRYRPDLEGLRAVAILAVIVAHAGVPGLAGGFIGVDVFFVLSGYLITGLLVEEYQANGRVDFAAFYVRRFRRLLPALLLMLGVSCVLARLLLSPTAQPSQATAAATSAVWLSNFHFAFSKLDYFSPGAESNLFLHTWSLGVEEQFYLVWPALLMLAMGKGASMENQRFRLRSVMLIVLLSSLLASIFLTAQSPLVAFYLMPTRAWQFALGALVFLRFGGLGGATSVGETPATATASSASNSSHATLQSWGGWLGLALIVAAIVGFDSQVSYPGFRALVPSLGAALILVAGAQAPWAGVGRLLSRRLMQAIGRVSYGWYLWHWPVLLLAREMAAQISWVHGLEWSAVSLVLAVISYRAFEKPIRQGRWMKASPRVALMGALGLMLCANAFAIQWHNSANDRMASPEQARYAKSRQEAPIIYGMGCDQWYHSAEVRICAFGPSDAAHTAVAMGDSIGLQWFPAFARAFSRPDWRLLVITKSSCPLVDEPFFYARIGREYVECEQWRKQALAEIVSLKPSLVILGSTFTYPFVKTQWIEGTARVLDELSAAAEQIYILRSTPVLPFDGPNCLVPRSWLYTFLLGEDHCSFRPNDPRSDEVFHWLQAAANRVPNASVIDMTEAVCPNGLCRAQLGDKIVFRDTQHLNAEFAQSLAPVLAKRMNLDHAP